MNQIYLIPKQSEEFLEATKIWQRFFSPDFSFLKPLTVGWIFRKKQTNKQTKNTQTSQGIATATGLFSWLTLCKYFKSYFKNKCKLVDDFIKMPIMELYKINFRYWSNNAN